MASLSAGPSERRRESRRAATALPWRPEAVLRPGQAVRLVNISRHAALVESDGRLRPGADTELHLASGARRTAIRGRLDRCHVSALDPLRYRGLLVFEQPLELDDPESSRRG